jgi:hypothetical protein
VHRLDVRRQDLAAGVDVHARTLDVDFALTHGSSM